MINSINVNISLPRGSLVSLLQKALLFAEAEIFSVMIDGDLDTKFEKAIGSMSLLEYGPYSATLCSKKNEF